MPSTSSVVKVGGPAPGRLGRLGEWCARHFVVVLVARLVTLLGRHAWRTPRWLDRVLPHIDAEGGGHG